MHGGLGRYNRPSLNWRRNRMQKEWALPAAAVVLLMIFVVTLVPVFVNADTFRPTVENQLSSSFGREVTMGRLTLSILAGNLAADDIAIADDQTTRCRRRNSASRAPSSGAHHPAEHRYSVHPADSECNRQMEFRHHWRSFSNIRPDPVEFSTRPHGRRT